MSNDHLPEFPPDSCSARPRPLPDRGCGRTRTAAARPSGTPSATRRAGRRRRHRRRGLRPLPPLPRGRRADGATWASDAYRFSVAWPRVQPDGGGPVNRRGLDFYDRLVDALLDAASRRWPRSTTGTCRRRWRTRGGWPNRDTAERFADYADGRRTSASATGSGLDHAQRAVVLGVPGLRVGRHAPGRRGARRRARRRAPPAARPRPG